MLPARTRFLVAALAALAVAAVTPAAAVADIGYEGPSFAGDTSAPTGEKPESKLWFNDGRWWAAMWDADTADVHVYRLDGSTQRWVDTNVTIDARPSKQDVLWDGSKLYVTSHVFSTSPATGAPTYLYRYSYAGGTYVLDPGFPVSINNYKLEAVVIDKDSTGTLWATWVQGGRVWIAHSLGSDLLWSTPVMMPVSDNVVSSDDISSVVRFAGSKIGVMWSDQTGDKFFHFAVHADGAGDTAWTHETVPLIGSQNSDDHINLKADSFGRVYAAIKRNSNSPDRLVELIVRSAAGTWSSFPFGTVSEDHTRPVVVLDEEHGEVLMYATGLGPSGTGDVVYEKRGPLPSPSFPPGLGTPVMRDDSSVNVNDSTSSKQNVSSATGLVIAASNDSTDRYWHAYVALGPQLLAANFAATPTSGPAHLTVAFTDLSTGGGGVNAWSWSFGDGGTSTARNPSHTYTTAGTYTVTLTVSDGTGSDTETKAGYVTVTPPPPLVADFSATPTSGTAPLAVAFTDLTAGGGSGPSGWLWSFGDGTTSTERNPSHTYTAVGTYTVTLTASDADESDIETKSGFITVLGGSAFQPVADAYVRLAKPDTRYGTQSSLRLRAGNDAHRTYLRFTVGGLSAPVASATLRLYATNGSVDAGTVYSVADTSWAESAITWNTAPPLGTTAHDSAGAVATGGWAELDVTAAVTGSGTYSFGLTSTSTDTAVFSSREGSNPPQLVIVQAPATSALTADFRGTPTSGTAPLTVAFTDLSTGGGSGPSGWLWSFGDGTTSTERNPSHTYAAVGSYTVTLTASDADETDAETKTGYVVVAPPPPLTANFSGTPTTGTAPLAVAFTDLSTGGGSGPTSWLWDFGDGTTSTEQSPTHVYAAAGSYTVSLTASDADETDAEVKTGYVVVSPAPPLTANFSGTPTTGPAPLAVAFTDLSSGAGGAVTWLWDFGDGTTSTERNPSHTYAAVGTYTVTLTVTDADETDAETKAGYVAVTSEAVFAPLADAYVKEASPTTNYGTQLILRVREAVGDRFHSYLKFAVAGLAGPPASAKLRLWVADPSPDGGAVLSVADSTWTETGITWSTRPPAIGGPLAAIGATTLGTWVEVDVTPAIGGDGTYSFVLTTTSSNSSFYDSREGAHPPQLRVAATP